jgi:hypothetical protein
MPSTDRRRQCRERLIRVLTLPPRAKLVVDDAWPTLPGRADVLDDAFDLVWRHVTELLLIALFVTSSVALTAPVLVATMTGAYFVADLVRLGPTAQLAWYFLTLVVVVEFSALRKVVVLLSATTLNQPTDQRPPLKQSRAA